MALFDQDAEKIRKMNLKNLEDKRVAFATELAKRNFRPERMLLCADEDGSFTALARVDQKLAVITAPKFGSDDDYALYLLENPEYEREEIFIKGTGLNGAFGFGIKGASGFKLHIKLSEDKTALLEAVSGRSSALEVMKYSKNPLLNPKRRRGDANIVWDFMPLDMAKERKAREAVDTYYLPQ